MTAVSKYERSDQLCLILYLYINQNTKLHTAKVASDGKMAAVPILPAK